MGASDLVQRLAPPFGLHIVRNLQLHVVICTHQTFFMNGLSLHNSIA